MGYRIEEIKFFVRETKPGRFPTALGKAAQDDPPQHVTSPLCHARLVLRDDNGKTTFGCAADRLSVRWLDKRPGRTTTTKRRELGDLLDKAASIHLARPEFPTPFAQWLKCHPEIMAAGREAQQEDLTSSFASAILERALLDAVCRLEGKSLFAMLRNEAIGFRPQEMHDELAGLRFSTIMASQPVTSIHVRHTVGIFDPLTDEDWPASSRLNDGLPETLVDYIRQYGIRYFKVKISGDTTADLRRLARLWEIMPLEAEPVITLDANEAFDKLEPLTQFVERLEREQLGLFQHIAYLEQPLRRDRALSPSIAKQLAKLGQSKDIIIDESDGTVDAFKQAWKLGYSGTSHKNCKGVFKSLANLALASHLSTGDRTAILSGEDLQNLPVVPLQQDLVTVGILGLKHCERNGHHYNFGLSMLSERDKRAVTARHPDLYEQRDGEWFLRIRDGQIQCASLHGPGFGVQDEPDWDSMTPLHSWLHRAE